MKKNLISILIIFLIFIPLFIFGGIPFSIVMGLLGLITYKELIDLKFSHNKIPFLVILIGIICLFNIMYQNFDGYSLYLGFSYQSICMTIVLLLLPTLLKIHYETKDAFYMIGIIILLGVFFNGVILLESFNKYILLYLILITVVSDTFAWLIGNLIGHHKLTNISPNKTIEGAVAGLIMGSIVSSVYYLLVIGTTNNIKVIVMSIVLSIIAQIGDLLFSKIKRENNLKDFYSLIPGHGGLLDVIDSLVITVISYIWLINFF